MAYKGAVSASLLLVAVVVCTLVSLTESFPNGAPIEACIYKTVPNHPGTKTLSDNTMHHEFVATSGSYRPRDTITVFLNANGKKGIKGYFIQAIDDNYKPIGSFVKDKYSKLHDECSSITHTHPGPKKTMQFIWKAPKHGHGGNVYFRATILESYEKYWSKVFAKVLRPVNYF